MNALLHYNIFVKNIIVLLSILLAHIFIVFFRKKKHIETQGDGDKYKLQKMTNTSRKRKRYLYVDERNGNRKEVVPPHYSGLSISIISVFIYTCFVTIKHLVALAIFIFAFL